jgi:UDP-hydrolysing UDP-N-acetyl-D-glucosamine 2-epimerase
LEDLEPVRAHQKNYGLGEEIKLLPERYITVIQHPVTTEYESSLAHVRETISALEELREPTVWIMPNMDAGSDGINKGIRIFRETRQLDYIHFFKSLPIELFAPLLKNTACIVGNSSCGIRESAFLGAPSVNIGTRQHCRERAQNVTDVDYDRHEIVEAIRQQISRGRYEPSDLYGDGHAAEKIVEVLRRHEFKLQKTITY